MLMLKEGLESCDNKKIIIALTKLRKLSKVHKIETETFRLLVELIKQPNEKVLNYSLSILANCCVNEIYRKLYKDFGGLPHLILIIRTVENDSIICRACRLIGNLAGNKELASDICKMDVAVHLLQLTEHSEKLSRDTVQMIFRALDKVSTAKEFKNTDWSKDSLTILKSYLISEEKPFVTLAVKILFYMTGKNSFQKTNIEPDREVFLKLIELAKNKDLNIKVLLTLSNLISYQTFSIWSFLEGSKIYEIFADYIQKEQNLNEGILRAFGKLCTLGGIRFKVRESGLLLRLIELCNSTNVETLLNIFYSFQFDIDSMMICSQNPKFTSLLIANISLQQSVQLLTVLSRLDPPVKELVLEENFDVIIKSGKCFEILRNIAKTGQFLKPLLISGKVWQLVKANCVMDDLWTPELTEYFLSQLLCSREKKFVDHVQLAVPFLVKSSQFSLLQKLFLRYNIPETILRRFQENPMDEEILACIIRLFKILIDNYHKPEHFFQDFVGGDPESMDSQNEMSNLEILHNNIENEGTENDVITFELDDGSCVEVNKNLICKSSPFFNSLINGHFQEARQEIIKLRRCTRSGFLLLVNMLQDKIDIIDIKIEIHLELLSLTDRFLLPQLNSLLTDSLHVNATNWPNVYKWYREAGFTKNYSKIGCKVYEFIFLSSENLFCAMKNESCKSTLVNEISHYLSSTFETMSVVGIRPNA